MSEAEVLALLGDKLAGIDRIAIERHLDACDECLELVTLAAKASSPGRIEPVIDRSSGKFYGRYELGELVGAGGMGAVYAARDAQLGRDVAIKVVHPSLAGHAESQLGLLREAQAMARITHPNVLTVYDVGVVDDGVFVAVELVAGDTLELWTARSRGWRQITQVFLQAARGLEAAHAAGLIHRDFKPSNVLVGADGRVRVFDFGLARFTDRAATRELAGTPLYMSPEQRRGDIADARSDQYSFAVSLHEGLFDAHPDETPHHGDVPRWLADIVRKALDTDPQRRFASMAEMIRALERGLARRSRALVAAGAVFAVCAAAAFGWLGYARGEAPIARCRGDAGVAGAWTEARSSQLADAFRATKLPYAETTWQHVARQIDRVAADWDAQHRDACVADTDERLACLDHERIVFDAIVDRLAAADRSTVDQAHRLLGSLPDVGACAHPIGASWPDEPVERARIESQLRAAAEVSSLADDGHVKLAAERIGPLVSTARSPREQADAHYLAGHVAGLAAHYEDAVGAMTKSVWAAEAARDDELVVTATSELIHLVGTRQQRPADARWFVELARAAAERVGSTAARTRVGRAIGNLELIAGHFDAAERELTTARQLASDPVLVATLDMDLANLESQRGHHAAAEPLIRRAAAGFARELGELHPRHAQSLNNLGNALLDLQRYDDAAAVFDQAVAIFERALGPDHPDVAQTLGNAASVHIASGKLERARQLLVRAIAIHEAHDPAPVVLAGSLNNLAEVRRLQGAFGEAEQLYARSLEARVSQLGDHHPKVTQSLLSLAAMALLRKDIPTARALCDRASASIVGSDAADKALGAIAETCRGEVELAAGHAAAATTIFEHALALHAGGEDRGRLAETQFALARALPASARARALELATAARVGFESELAYRKFDLAEIDAWLAQHEL